MTSAVQQTWPDTVAVQTPLLDAVSTPIQIIYVALTFSVGSHIATVIAVVGRCAVCRSFYGNRNQSSKMVR